MLVNRKFNRLNIVNDMWIFGQHNNIMFYQWNVFIYKL